MLCLATTALATREPMTAIPGFAEPVSSISHLIATVGFSIATYRLLRSARGRPGLTVALAIYSGSVVFLLAMSGVFHLLPPGTTGRAVLQRLDHAGIFVLIAGTFTAVHAMLFRGWLRFGVIAFAWAVTATAVPLKTIYFNEMPEGLGLTLYLVFPWLGLGSGVLLWRRHGLRYIAPFFWGGLAFTLGAVFDFLRWPKLWPGVLHAHELFHLFVIAGVWFHWHFCSVLALEIAARGASKAGR